MNLALYTIIRGLAIGVLVSAPMGPIGILCIQRTLNKGRWSGFVTGLGAALSDLIYALLTGLGMSIVIDFMPRHEEAGKVQRAEVADSGQPGAGGLRPLSLPAEPGEEYPQSQLVDQFLYARFHYRLPAYLLQSAYLVSVYRSVCPLQLLPARVAVVAPCRGLSLYPRRGGRLVVFHYLCHQQSAFAVQCAQHLVYQPRYRYHHYSHVCFRICVGDKRLYITLR